MTARSPLSPELDALINREREIPPVSAAQRSRALARARATMAEPQMVAVHSRAPSRPRWIPAAAAVVASAALAAAAYELHTNARPTGPGAAAGSPVVAARLVPTEVRAPTQAPAVEQPPPPPAPADNLELRLIRQAHAAVVRGDYAAALRPIAEHARRFRDGRMAEEREALRIKVLAALGRTEEARRATASFRTRFPRSVLIPAIGRMLPSDP